MIIPFTYSFIEPNLIELSWTGTANYFSYIYVNGKPAASGPLDFGTETNRSAQIKIPDKFALELHEIEESEDIYPVNYDVKLFPTVKWNTNNDDKCYNIYIDDDFIQAEKNYSTRYVINSVIVKDVKRGKTSGNWIQFKIGAVNLANKESYHSFDYFVKSPLNITSVTCSGTSPNIRVLLM